MLNDPSDSYRRDQDIFFRKLEELERFAQAEASEAAAVEVLADGCTDMQNPTAQALDLLETAFARIGRLRGLSAGDANKFAGRALERWMDKRNARVSN